MKKLFLSSCILAASTAHAEPVNYLTGGLAFLNYDEPGLSATFDALDIGFGSKLNDFFSVGGKFMIGLNNDSVNVVGTSLDIGLKWSYTFEVKPTYPVGDAFDLYAVLGFTSGEIEAEALGVKITESDSGFSYGFGINRPIDDGYSLRLEYLNYLDVENAEVSGVNLGITKAFN